MQSAAVLQAGIRGLIVRRNYNRMRIEVEILRFTVVSTDFSKLHGLTWLHGL